MEIWCKNLHSDHFIFGWQLQIFLQIISLYVWNSNATDVFVALIHIRGLLYTTHVHMRICIYVRVCKNIRILSLNT